MIRHYLTFAHQADRLNRLMSGRVLAECWSQEKNRLILRFIEGTDSAFAEISLDLRIGYALPSAEIHRARKNTIDFFHDLLGARLECVEMHDTERMLSFDFADGRRLIVLFFGPGAGNVLLAAHDGVAESFHEFGDEYDGVLGEGADDDEYVTREELFRGLRDFDGPAQKALSAVLRRLGKRLTLESLYRADIRPDDTLSDMEEDAVIRLLDCVDEVYEEARLSTEYRIYHMPAETVFNLIRMNHLEDAEPEKVEVFDDLARSVRAFKSIRFKRSRFQSLKGRLAKSVEKERRRLERSLGHAQDTDSYRERADHWELTGNVLLANLHLIEKGVESVTLQDWEGNDIDIRLDGKKTPAENAERYFRKARSTRNEALHAQERSAELREKLRHVNDVGRSVTAAETVDALETIQATHNDIFRMKGEAKEKGTAERFRRFEVEGGYDVYAGKSAANNDELTMKFAKPNDIWLHARGASGSHVVLRWNDQKGRPPKRTLEEAAMIAAYYSGAKNSKLVPVAWTLKKYVRKPKGAAVGAVVMGREEVVMVEPRLPVEDGGGE